MSLEIILPKLISPNDWHENKKNNLFQLTLFSKKEQALNKSYNLVPYLTGTPKTPDGVCSVHYCYSLNENNILVDERQLNNEIIRD